MVCACLCATVGLCEGSIKNCTIECTAAGVASDVGENGFAEIENCILIGGGYPEGPPQITVEHGGIANVSFCCLMQDLQGQQGINWGPGNIVGADPCFARLGCWDLKNTPEDLYDDVFIAGDYHLRSEAGRWDPNLSRWTCDSVTSLCIDAGNPGCSISNEPLPNGNRINMGAFGGTPSASKSPANWRSIADLNNDRLVKFDDLLIFVQYWLQDGQCLPGDFNRSSAVNVLDFGMFANEWE